MLELLLVWLVMLAAGWGSLAVMVGGSAPPPPTSDGSLELTIGAGRASGLGSNEGKHRGS